MQASIEDIPLAVRKRSSAKTPVSPAVKANSIKSSKVSPVSLPAASAVVLSTAAKPTASVEDLPLAQRKRLVAKAPTSPFAAVGQDQAKSKATAPASDASRPDAQPTKSRGSAQPLSGAKKTTAAQAVHEDMLAQSTATKGVGEFVLPCCSADTAAKSRQATSVSAEQHKGASKANSISAAPQSQKLRKSDSNASSTGMSPRQHKSSKAGAQSARLVTDKVIASQSDKGKDVDEAKAVKGLPALSRSLSKKGSSTAVAGQTRLDQLGPKAVAASGQKEGLPAQAALPVRPKVSTQKSPKTFALASIMLNRQWHASCICLCTLL